MSKFDGQIGVCNECGAPLSRIARGASGHYLSCSQYKNDSLLEKDIKDLFKRLNEKSKPKMKKLKFKPHLGWKKHEELFADDIERICTIAALHGYQLDSSNACLAWEEYSDTYAAGWLILPEKDEDVWQDIHQYLEEE